MNRNSAELNLGIKFQFGYCWKTPYSHIHKECVYRNYDTLAVNTASHPSSLLRHRNRSFTGNANRYFETSVTDKAVTTVLEKNMLILQYKNQQFQSPSTVQLTQRASIIMKANIFILALCAVQVRQHTALVDIGQKLLQLHAVINSAILSVSVQHQIVLMD